MKIANPAYFISFHDLVQGNGWPTITCTKGHRKFVVNYYHFVSHRWLSKNHPDPSGSKFAHFKNWFLTLSDVYDKAQELGKNKTINERTIGRIDDIATQLLTASPVLWQHEIDFLSEFIAINSLSRKKREAKDILERICFCADKAMSTWFWIDSYATATHEHQDNCEFCSINYKRTMSNLPAILMNADGVVAFDGFSSDDHERGWILLERTLAASSGWSRSTSTTSNNQDAFDNSASLFLNNGKYKCSRKSEEKQLPILFSYSCFLEHFTNIAVAGNTDDHYKTQWVLHTVSGFVFYVYFSIYDFDFEPLSTEHLFNDEYVTYGKREAIGYGDDVLRGVQVDTPEFRNEPSEILRLIIKGLLHEVAIKTFSKINQYLDDEMTGLERIRAICADFVHGIFIAQLKTRRKAVDVSRYFIGDVAHYSFELCASDERCPRELLHVISLMVMEHVFECEVFPFESVQRYALRDLVVEKKNQTVSWLKNQQGN